MRRLVVDTDPGVDDAHALMMALAHPGARIEAILTVAGNVGVEQTTANACLVLDRMDVPENRVPVYRGASRALLPTRKEDTSEHGKDGLGDTRYPPSRRCVEAEHAALALIRLAAENPGELTLVTLGPLTNIALATRLDPALPGRIRRLVMMGGVIHKPGGPEQQEQLEFNIKTDPEAAAIVFDAWPDITLVSWEAAMNHLLSPEHVDYLTSCPTERGEFWRRITRQKLENAPSRTGRPGLYAPDQLAMAVACEPDIVKQSEPHAVSIELCDPDQRGRTLVDWEDKAGRPANVNLVLEVDRERFWELLKAPLDKG